MRDEIAERVAELGLDLAKEQLDALVTHAQLMLQENETRNLTRIVEPADVAVLHVADSLSALPFLASAPPGRFADLGAGAGYPGIPLAVVSRRPLTLVESRSGKSDFLRRVVDALGLDAEVRPVRAEELAQSEAGEFSAVAARAVAALPALVELAAPLLRDRGLLLAMKGDVADVEVERGNAVAAIVGMGEGAVHRVRIPGTDASRTIVVFERTGKSSVRLPRRPGMAQRQPLA